MTPAVELFLHRFYITIHPLTDLQDFVVIFNHLESNAFLRRTVGSGVWQSRDLSRDDSVENNVVSCYFNVLTDGTIAVTYIPQLGGTLQIALRWKGLDIAGSPFFAKVVESRTVVTYGSVLRSQSVSFEAINYKNHTLSFKC